MASAIEPLPSDYQTVLAELKLRVRSSRLTAQRRVNTELISLYWAIGNTVLERQVDQDWGAQVVARLAKDLRAEFPTMKGFSRSNLFYMRAFAQAWTGREQLVQQAAGLLPWGHIMVLLDKLDSQSDRDWYAEKAAEHGWSRNVLMNQIMNRTLELTGAAPSNFAGQLGFYIGVVDDKMRRDFHRPTVGILICSSHNEHTVRYALAQTGSPMAVSTYSYDALPIAEQQVLPTADQIAAALRDTMRNPTIARQLSGL